MQKGDIVVLPRKLTSQIAIGRVTGPYRHIQVNSELRHTRPVEWIRTDVPRTAFEQDLLYSFGAFLTVCNISRNDAARRVLAVLEEKPDPGPSIRPEPSTKESPLSEDQTEVPLDLTQMAHDQIVAHIQSRFAGHALTDLVDAVLQVDGWVTRVSPPGPDGGVDILAGRGSLGLDGPPDEYECFEQNLSETLDAAAPTSPQRRYRRTAGVSTPRPRPRQARYSSRLTYSSAP